MKDFIIRKMEKNEVQTAIDWAAKEGWNPGLFDAQCFYEADPQGFFVGLFEGEPIAVGSAVVYDENYAFCGLYIVKKEFRGQGYGLQLTNARLAYAGKRITGIDGVLENVSKYQKIGYVPAFKNIRYALKKPLVARINSENCVNLNQVPFSQLEAFDRRYFPAQRTRFLKSWISQPESVALGFVEGGKLSGYGVIRKCISGYKIGPLFATAPLIADTLFQALVTSVKEGPVFLDTPEPNKEAQKLVKKYQMEPTFEVIRMYRNGEPKIEWGGVFGLTTYELG